MSVRIRVYPQSGLGLGAAGLGYGGYGTLANVRLQDQKRTSALQLQYERALWAERLKSVQLQTALQYGGTANGPRIVAPFGGAMLGAGMLGAGMFGMGGLGAVLPRVLTGNGQTNITNQTSTGGNQSVTNANTSSSHLRPGFAGAPWGYPTASPWFGGGGGFFSSLLGALI